MKLQKISATSQLWGENYFWLCWSILLFWTPFDAWTRSMLVVFGPALEIIINSNKALIYEGKNVKNAFKNLKRL